MHRAIIVIAACAMVFLLVCCCSLLPLTRSEAGVLMHEEVVPPILPYDITHQTDSAHFGSFSPLILVRFRRDYMLTA